MSDFDRFVEFLRREAATYHEPPATPRDELWTAVETGLRDDRFVEFLQREGASYHEPPVTPRDEIWAAVEAGWLEARAAIAAEEDAPVDPAALAYNEPGAAPRDEMWPRIEAAWRMRSSVDPPAREAGLDDLGDAPAESERRVRSRERRTVGLWIAGIAVAASLVLGVVIGRGTVPFGASGPQVAGVDSTAGTPAGDAVQQESTVVPDGSAFAAGPETDPAADAVESLESGPRLVADDPMSDDATESAPDAVQGEERGDSRLDADRRNRVVRYATARHLGRAETLLAAFRAEADDDEAGLAEFAGWARDLLGETRLLLDTPADRSPEEQAILREVELLLTQIGQLGPDAPAFERELVEEGIERQGTLPRLRAAMPQSVSGT
jgi:hypothetical protein